MKKVLVSDYDRTFYLDDNDIEKNKQYLRKFQDNGNIFILATGRSYFDFKKIISKYKINYDFAIINHGATILDKDNNIMYLSYINNDILNSLIIDLKLSQTKNNFLCSKLESRVSINHKDITKINVEYEEEEITKKVNEEINKKYSSYINAYLIGPTKIEIVSKDSSKLQAIKYIEKKLDLEKNNIYTIGDGNSDIEMVKYYNGYCMEKSVPILKEFAIKKMGSVSCLIRIILNEEE